jgi:hypothetical protein
MLLDVDSGEGGLREYGLFGLFRHLSNRYFSTAPNPIPTTAQGIWEFSCWIGNTPQC